MLAAILALRAALAIMTPVHHTCETSTAVECDDYQRDAADLVGGAE